MGSSVSIHKVWMMSSLKTTRIVVQFLPYQECSTEKFDRTFAHSVSFTCFIHLYSYWQWKLTNQGARICSVIVKKEFEVGLGAKSFIIIFVTCSFLFLFTRAKERQQFSSCWVLPCCSQRVRQVMCRGLPWTGLPTRRSFVSTPASNVEKNPAW